MAKARFEIPRFEIPSQLPAGVTRPLYAGVGATDRVVAVVREAVADVSRRASSVREELSAIDPDPQALRRQATDVVAAGVVALQSEAKDLPVRLQRVVDEQLTTANDAFGELVKQGEKLVGRIRRQSSTTATVSSARTTTAKARTTRTQAAKTAKKTTAGARSTARRSPATSSAKATATAARKTARSATRAAGDAAKKVGD
jgi:heparin binding hemagglutinin HbhA